MQLLSYCRYKLLLVHLYDMLLFVGLQTPVCSIPYEGSDITPFPDEVDDLRVNHMVSLFRNRFPFEINTWHGGAKDSNAKQSKGFGGLGGCTSEGVGLTGENAEAEQG